MSNSKKTTKPTPAKPAPEKTGATMPSLEATASAKAIDTGRRLVTIKRTDAEINGRAYRVGEQELVTPETAQLLIETGVAELAMTDQSGEEKVLCHALTKMKVPGGTWYRGHRARLPLSVAKERAAAGQLKIVGI